MGPYGQRAWQRKGRKQVVARVPGKIHAWITARAREEGVSMSDLVGDILLEAMVRDELHRAAETIHPSPAAINEIIRRRLTGDRDE